VTGTKVLVVYYSKSGTTRALATAIAQATGADIEEIVETRRRDGVAGYMRSLIEAIRRQQPPIELAKMDPSAYDLVLIGSPVWANSIPSPVRSYLTANKARLANVAFFCTLGGRGGASMFTQMQGLLGKTPRDCIAVFERTVKSGGYGSAIAEFIFRLGIAAPRHDRAVAA
jgi:flavodoxin